MLSREAAKAVGASEEGNALLASLVIPGAEKFTNFNKTNTHNLV